MEFFRDADFTRKVGRNVRPSAIRVGGRLKATNDEVLATGTQYTAATTAVYSVKANGLVCFVIPSVTENWLTMAIVS
jgi:hypothetical protein